MKLAQPKLNLQLNKNINNKIQIAKKKRTTKECINKKVLKLYKLYSNSVYILTSNSKVA